MSRLLLATGLTTFLSMFSSMAMSATAVAQSVAQSSEPVEIAARDLDPSPFPTANRVTSARSDIIGTEQPVSGSQLYHQRLAALQSSQLYTRLSGSSFQSDWMGATEPPTYEQWKALLVEEAQLVTQTPQTSRLSIVLGDSLSLWMPSGGLPEGQLWLNQGISGDTTRGILHRLSAIAETDPDRIYILAGVNDLKHGVEDAEILDNYRQILRQLKQDHPQTETIVQSILPTRLETIPNDRIRQINHQLSAIAQQEGATFLNLSTYLADARGELHPSLTTDGLHLNDRGYEAWQWILQQIELGIAMS